MNTKSVYDLVVKQLIADYNKLQFKNVYTRCKCGIEIIGLTPARDKLGKCCFQGYPIKKLLPACYDNKVFGCKNMTKLQLVEALLKL